mgnify:CR=1 FL=1
MNKSEKFFDKISSKSKPEPDITASKIIDSSIEYLEESNYVLDFGCGSGAITNKIAKEARAIDAIDISSGMLDFAKEQAEKGRRRRIRGGRRKENEEEGKQTATQSGCRQTGGNRDRI